MRWKPDKSNPEPIYKQIARYFEEQILCGELAPGTALPTERELAQLLQVNRSTVTTAYEDLRATGLVHSIQGSGTWVNHHLWGVAPRKLPNWQQYTNGGAFLPTLPLLQSIRKASQDPTVIQLSRGELSPPLTPTSILEELIREQTPLLSLEYPHPKGDVQLREAVADHLREEYSINADPEQILITSGAQQALHIITLCLLSPGDAIAMEGPSYAYSLQMFPSAGLRLYLLPVDDGGLRPEEVRSLYQKHKIRMIFTNPTFQNPTGTILPLHRRKELLAICEELRIPIVEDDAYGAITHLDTPSLPPSLMALNQKGGGSSVIYIGSLSKVIGPGLRIGWIVGPRSVINRLADAKQQMDYGTNSFTQQLVSRYLSQPLWKRQIATLQSELMQRRNQMLAALDEHLRDWAKWTVPKGSYHIWCKLNQPIPDKVLLTSAIQHGILMSPGGIYGADPGYVRFTYSWEEPKRMAEGIQRFRHVLEKL